MCRSFLVVVSIGIVLAGCTTTAEQAAQAEREADQMVQIYGPACVKLGFTADTDPWRNCIIGLSQKDAAYRYGYNGYYGSPYRYHPYWW